MGARLARRRRLLLKRASISALTLLCIAGLAKASAYDTLLAYLPPSSAVVTGVDVTKAAASRSGSIMLRQVVDDQGVASLLAAVDLNVRRDLRQILVAGMGQRQSRSDGHDVLVASGLFHSAHLVAAARVHGVSVRQYRGVTMLTQIRGKAGYALAFPRAGVVVMGVPMVVQRVLDNMSHGQTIDPLLRLRMNEVASQSDVWFATILSGSYLLQQTADALPSSLRNSQALDRITSSSGGLRFGSDDTLMMHLVTTSPRDARVMADVLRLASGLAHLQLGNKPEMVLAGTILSAMTVTVAGEIVQVGSAVPDAQLERALMTSQ